MNVLRLSSTTRCLGALRRLACSDHFVCTILSGIKFEIQVEEEKGGNIKLLKTLKMLFVFLDFSKLLFFFLFQA